MTSSGIASVATLMNKGAVSENRQKSDVTDDVFGMFLGRNLVQADQSSSDSGQAQITYDGERNNVSFKDLKIPNAKLKQTYTKTEQKISEKLDDSSKKLDESGKMERKSIGETDELPDSLDRLEKKVKEILMNNLEVTEEDLIKAMAELGLGFLSLLDIPNLKNLMMELTATEDIGSLLLNEEFQTIYADIGTITQDLLAELGMTQEELEAVLQQMTLAVQEPETSEAISKAKVPDDTEIPEYQVKQDPTKEQKVVLEEEPKTEQVQDTKQKDTIPTVNEEVSTKKKEAGNQNARQDKNLFQKGQGQEQEKQLQSQVTVQTTQTTQVQTGEEVIQTIQHTYVDVDDIIRQVTEFTRVQIGQTESTIEMQLNPAHLGKLYLQVSTKDGMITAHLATQNEAVKAALESQVALLKENMNQQGMKVEAVEVTIASHEFERNLEGNQQSQTEQEASRDNHKNSRRNITMDSLDDLDGIMSEEESLAVKMMRDNGNNMDLNA